MVFRPKIMSEAIAYGRVPSHQAYGATGNKKYAQAEYNNYATDADEGFYDNDSMEDFIKDNPDYYDYLQHQYEDEELSEDEIVSNIEGTQTPNLHATFDGERLKVYNNDEIIGDYRAQSGKKLYQSKIFTDYKDNGPIPEGQYTIDYDRFETYDPQKRDSGKPEYKWMKRTKSWGYERAPIVPAAGTDTKNRGDFYLHGGKKLGSAGCIDLSIQMPQMGGLMKKYQTDIPLTVKYKDDFGEISEKK